MGHSDRNSLNQSIRYLLFRQPVGLPTKQNGLDLIQHPHGNGWSVKPNDQHGPLRSEFSQSEHKVLAFPTAGWAAHQTKWSRLDPAPSREWMVREAQRSTWATQIGILSIRA